MPPWFAHTEPDTDSPWTNDRSLSRQDRADLIEWIDSKDRPMGDPADAPRRLAFSREGWQIGEPDLVEVATWVTLASNLDMSGKYNTEINQIRNTLSPDQLAEIDEIIREELYK